MIELTSVMEKKKSIGILGAGAFGTALAFVYHSKFDVTLFSSFSDHVELMKRTRTNKFLDGFVIPSDIQIVLTDELVLQ